MLSVVTGLYRNIKEKLLLYPNIGVDSGDGEGGSSGIAVSIGVSKMLKFYI